MKWQNRQQISKMVTTRWVLHKIFIEFSTILQRVNYKKKFVHSTKKQYKIDITLFLVQFWHNNWWLDSNITQEPHFTKYHKLCFENNKFMKHKLWALSCFISKITKSQVIEMRLKKNDCSNKKNRNKIWKRRHPHPWNILESNILHWYHGG